MKKKEKKKEKKKKKKKKKTRVFGALIPISWRISSEIFIKCAPIFF